MAIAPLRDHRLPPTLLRRLDSASLQEVPADCDRLSLLTHGFRVFVVRLCGSETNDQRVTNPFGKVIDQAFYFTL